MSKFKSEGKERYVLLRHWLLKSPAWRSLPVGARALYVELVLRYNGHNNGRISYSLREAVEALHISKSTADHLFTILQARGFIVCTRKGAFSLKTTKDASEWQLTEYASDHPPAHATKEFMRWQLPEDVDIDTLNRQPSHHRKSKTRVPQANHTGTPGEPHGYPSGTVKRKKRQNGYPRRTVKAENAPATGTPEGHLYIPGSSGGGPVAPSRAVEAIPDGARPLACLNPYTVVAKNGAGMHWVTARDTFPDGEAAPKKPWTTPTIDEIPWDTVPAELRMMALSLPVPAIEPEPKPKYRPEELAF
jgi:hypothetical protein